MYTPLCSFFLINEFTKWNLFAFIIFLIITIKSYQRKNKMKIRIETAFLFKVLARIGNADKSRLIGIKLFSVKNKLKEFESYGACCPTSTARAANYRIQILHTFYKDFSSKTFE